MACIFQRNKFQPLSLVNSDTNAQGINRNKNEAKSTFFARTERLFSKMTWSHFKVRASLYVLKYV